MYKKNNNKKWLTFTDKRYYICGKPKHRFFKLYGQKGEVSANGKSGIVKKNKRGNNQFVITGANKKNIKK